MGEKKYVLLLLVLVVISTLSFVLSQNDSIVYQENITNETINESIGNLTDETCKEEKGINLISGGIKISKNEIPEKIINSSDDFIKSFIDKNDFNKNLRFGRVVVLNNSIKNTKEYLLVYYLQIEYLRETGKKVRSIYPINIRLDEDGIVIDKVEPMGRYNYLKTRGI